MRALQTRMVIVMTMLFVALAVSQGGPSTLAVASIAALAIAGVVAVRSAAIVVGAREMTVGARAHAHREALHGMPAPQHPTTPGRPRPRAPSQAAPAT